LNVAIPKKDVRFLAFLFIAGVLLAGFFFSRASLLSGGAVVLYPAPAAFNGARPLHGLPVDINAATAEELRLVPGIGRRLSDRIVEKRGRSGGFREIDELAHVAGISGAKLERIRAFITISEGRAADEGNKPPRAGK